MFDLLIQNANVYGKGAGLDIAMRGGTIAAIGRGIPAEQAGSVIAAQGRFVSPGFVDSHMHFDKALTMSDKESCNLIEAIASYAAYCDSLSEDALAEDITRRARQIVKMVVANGTTSARTHANLDFNSRYANVRALAQLKKDMKDFIDIQISALPTFYPDPADREKSFAMLEDVCAKGLIDYIGGSPFFSSHEQNARNIDRLFSIAQKYDMPIDVHVDEADEPDVHCLEYIADKTIETGYQGRVSCGHVTAMNAVDEETRNRVIEKCHRADLQIISLPSCNLFLMGRQDQQPVRRGITTVKEFLAGGVNVSFASDNIRDPFRPYGNGDMLEECLLTVQILQMALREELESVYRMGTCNPARAMRLGDYGLDVGKRADMILFETKDLADTIISQGVKSAVIKNGRVVANTKKEITMPGWRD